MSDTEKKFDMVIWSGHNTEMYLMDKAPLNLHGRFTVLKWKGEEELYEPDLEAFRQQLKTMTPWLTDQTVQPLHFGSIVANVMICGYDPNAWNDAKPEA